MGNTTQNDINILGIQAKKISQLSSITNDIIENSHFLTYANSNNYTLSFAELKNQFKINDIISFNNAISYKYDVLLKNYNDITCEETGYINLTHEDFTYTAPNNDNIDIKNYHIEPIISDKVIVRDTSVVPAIPYSLVNINSYYINERNNYIAPYSYTSYQGLITYTIFNNLLDDINNAVAVENIKISYNLSYSYFLSHYFNTNNNLIISIDKSSDNSENDYIENHKYGYLHVNKTKYNVSFKGNNFYPSGLDSNKYDFSYYQFNTYLDYAYNSTSYTEYITKVNNNTYIQLCDGIVVNTDFNELVRNINATYTYMDKFINSYMNNSYNKLIDYIIFVDTNHNAKWSKITYNKI